MKINRILNESAQDYERLYRNGRQPGIGIGLNEFDQYLTFKKKSTLYVYGAPYSGKSTFWHFVAIQLAHLHGWKFALFTPETGDAHDIFGDLTEFLLRKRFMAGQWGITEEERLKAMKFINAHFVVLTGCNTPDEFLKLADDAADHFGQPVDCASCDPWNEFYHDMREHGGRDLYLEHQLGKFREDARAKDRLNVIVTHPAREEFEWQDQGEGVPKFRYLPVTKPNQIAGGQAWPRKGLNMISVWRPPMPEADGRRLIYPATGAAWEDNAVLVSVDKVKPRELGTRGTSFLYFDFQKKCYFSKIGRDEIYPPQWQVE